MKMKKSQIPSKIARRKKLLYARDGEPE